ncbi:hypothetical protein GCM10009835_12020 [Planosporangium flavigriseum]|uniref:Uncharacterized protein n=1 Tax=Planosporangium flavigriseum TaxID=373681 RepID=A0A8J3LTM1_9ACTN|nr:hypothetical protein Pfl04_47520 [Planosporangium flavigriseum]
MDGGALASESGHLVGVAQRHPGRRDPGPADDPGQHSQNDHATGKSGGVAPETDGHGGHGERRPGPPRQVERREGG